MLALLGEFIFESGNVNLDNIKSETEYDYTTTKTIDDFEHWHSTGKFSTTLTLAGKLVKKPNSSLNELEEIAERKEAITLAFDDGQAKTVVIMKINKDRSSFLKSGAFLVQDFEVLLGVVNGTFNSQ